MPVVANTRHSMNGDRLSTATETGIGAIADTLPPDVARRDDVSTSNRCINFHTYVILGGMILSTQLDEGLNYCTNGFVTFVFWLRLVTKHSIPDAKKLLNVLVFRTFYCTNRFTITLAETSCTINSSKNKKHYCGGCANNHVH